MVKSPGLRMKDAYEQAGSELSLSPDRLKSVERSIRNYLKEELDIAYVETVGKHLKITSKVKANAEAIESSLAKIDGELQNITGLKSSPTHRGTVKVATIISVIHYLGPALVGSLQAREAEEVGSVVNPYLCPHVEMIYGEIDVHLRMLQSKQVDFVIGRNVDISLANSLDKQSLPMVGKTRGIVFRYKGEGNRTPAFPLLVEALRSNDKEKFLSALCASPMILLSRIWTDAPDPFISSLTELVKKWTGSSKHGPTMSVPTARSGRQFVQMGSGVGFGHMPLDPPRITAKKAGIHGLGAVMGRDPECPEVDLVYLPFEALGLVAPDSEPTTFAIYYRRKTVGLDRGNIKNADLTAEAVEVINEVVSITEGLRGDFGIFKFDSFGLMHDFHFAGDGAFKCITRPSNRTPLPVAKQFATGV